MYIVTIKTNIPYRHHSNIYLFYYPFFRFLLLFFRPFSSFIFFFILSISSNAEL